MTDSENEYVVALSSSIGNCSSLDEILTNDLSDITSDDETSIPSIVVDDIVSDDENEMSSTTLKAKEANKKIKDILIIAATIYYSNYMLKMPCHDRNYSGWAAIMSMLNGAPKRCYENLRMHKQIFFDLCKVLVEDYGLRPSRHISVEEQLATFLMIVGPKEGNRQLQETLQRSDYTISKSFHKVLKACTKMAIAWVRPFDDFSTTHPYIKENSQYYPHFKDCIGAIDGTHIKASLPVADQIPFIGRKGSPTQNIMAACDFDLCFIYSLPGWEGSAHDTRIFYSVIRDPSKGFPMPPPGKYYLVDAGYPNISGFLAPYKGHKYHMPEFRRAQNYNNHYEVFNHMHLSLRSTIERSFGVWKAKWAILSNMPVNILWPDQVALVPATMAIHNFIQKNDAFDDDFLQFENYQAEGYNIDDGETQRLYHGSYHSDADMNKKRDDICTSINFARIGILL